MKIHRIATLVVLSAFAASSASASDAPTKFGKPLQGLKPTTVAEVLAKPQAGQIVRLEGVIEAVCQEKGCWIGLKQGDQAIHVAMEGHSFFLPKDSKGRKVAVEGKVIVKERAKAEVEHLEAEGAKQAAAKVSIEATGVELLAGK